MINEFAAIPDVAGCWSEATAILPQSSAKKRLKNKAHSSIHIHPAVDVQRASGDV
jgi:hypothetical protein